MPELPEVETIKLGLERRIKGLEIKDIRTNSYGMLKGDKDKVVGATVKDIRRRAKILIIDLKRGVIPVPHQVRDKLQQGIQEMDPRVKPEDDKVAPEDDKITPEDDMGEDYSIVIHLKMTGQLVFQSADEKVKVVGGHPQAEYNRPLPHAHTHIIITFADGSHLYFNDLRRFGWMKVMPADNVSEEPGIAKAGPEPLGEGHAEGEFKNQKSKIKDRIQRTRKPIKVLLMDQSFIAGIGNIYSDEILYTAGIRPDRPAVSLTEEETETLFKTIPRVLKKALAHGGTSDSTYIGVDGERGDYLKVAAVYHKIKDPQGHRVERKKIGGRTAHFCPACQR